MIQIGHFAELDNILRLTARQPVLEADGDNEASGHSDPFSNNDSLQTFIFSATLSKDLQENISKRHKSRDRSRGSSGSTLGDLLRRLDFRDTAPEIIDLSPMGGVVSTLNENKIECLISDKDVYLYYFLLRYPGRSLVFLSSIDGIRRLVPLLELLNLKAYPLHSQLEQKQRLRNLDRFKSTANSVLLATDVAARGLDIPAIEHVIHYQLPRSTDVYVHRNGRTARARRTGFALLLSAPDERKALKAILRNLGRGDDEIPDLIVELDILDQLKARIQVAREVDKTQHRVKKAKHDRNWLREAADALEVDLDSEPDSDENDNVSRRSNARASALKAELKLLLSQPVVARGVSAKYVTSGSRAIAHDIVTGEYHETMLGLKKEAVHSTRLSGKRKSKKGGSSEI